MYMHKCIGLLCIIVIACALLASNKMALSSIERFAVLPPLPPYHSSMSEVKYPYADGPFYHDAPNWFDMWASRNTQWRMNNSSIPGYDSDTIDNGATVPLPPKQININGNKSPNTFEQFACIITDPDTSNNSRSALPYYGAEVTSIFGQLNKPADQTYDWSKFKLGGIPANDMVSTFSHMNTPADQSYDWSKFNLLEFPNNNVNAGVKSIYGELLPTTTFTKKC